MQRSAGWTTDDMPDMSGKIALVTGANSGIGFETTKALADHHCHVVMACRDLARGNAAKQAIVACVPHARLDVMLLDLSDLASVKEFSDQFKNKYPHLNLLINNAAVANVDFGFTKDGFETFIGTNFLGPFALTAQLYPSLLKANCDARIVTVGSEYHKEIPFDFDNFYGEKPYHNLIDSLKVYGNSKMADKMFAFEMARRFAKNNIPVISLAAHPGAAATNISQPRGGKKSGLFERAVTFVVNHTIAQSPAQGALTILRAATDDNVINGDYFGPHKDSSGYPIKIQTAKHTYDEVTGKRLWEIAERLTGIRFNVDPHLHAINEQRLQQSITRR